MSYSNEDMVSIAEDAIKSIEMAISELEGVNEYSDAKSILEEAIRDIKYSSAIYELRYQEELEEEREEANIEYMRSVI